MNQKNFLTFALIFLVSAISFSSSLNVDIPVPTNYSLIPTVNNSEYFDGYSVDTLWTYFSGLGDDLWCELTGCNMTGDLDVSGNVSFTGPFETTCLHCEDGEVYFHGDGFFEGNVTAPNIEVMESLIVHGNSTCTGTATACGDIGDAGLCGWTTWLGQRGCRWTLGGSCIGTATPCDEMSTATCEEQHVCSLTYDAGFIFGVGGFDGNIVFHDNVTIEENLNVVEDINISTSSIIHFEDGAEISSTPTEDIRFSGNSLVFNVATITEDGALTSFDMGAGDLTTTGDLQGNQLIDGTYYLTMGADPWVLDTGLSVDEFTSDSGLIYSDGAGELAIQSLTDGTYTLDMGQELWDLNTNLEVNRLVISDRRLYFGADASSPNNARIIKSSTGDDRLTIASSISGLTHTPIYWHTRAGATQDMILDINGNLELVSGDLTLTDGNINVGGNLSVSGNITGNQIYGGMFYHNHTATLINFESAETYYNLFMTNATHLNGFTYNGAFNKSSNLTAQFAGLYSANFMSSGDGINNHEYYSSIFVNGVNQENCENHKKMSAGGDIVTQTGICFIELDVNDIVDVRTADFTDASLGNYYSSNLNLVRIGD